MVVFQILYSLDMGGIEEFASNMAKCLSADDISNYIVLLSVGRDLKWCEAKRQKIIENGSKVIDLSGLSRFKKFIQLTVLARKICPDVIIVHHELNTLRVIPAILSSKAKLIQIQHNTRIKGIKRQRLFCKYAVHNYVAVSDDVKTAMTHLLKTKGKRVEVFNNGIFTDEYRNEHNKKNTVCILAAGRFTEQKNFVELAGIFKDILSEPNLGNVEIVMAGHGETLEEVRETLNSDQRTNLPGAVIDMRELYSGADIYVSYSLYEGFSLTLLEAMASGCAVLATATSGTINIICNQVNGILVEVGDRKGFTNELMDLVADSGKRRRLSEAAVLTVKDYDFSLTYQKYLRLFRNILNESEYI